MYNKIKELYCCLKTCLNDNYKKHDQNKLRDVSEEEYFNDLIRNPKKREKAFNKAWENKNFEIGLYWKRATYFWAFQVASFTGYFAFLSSEVYAQDPQILYFVCCIGLLTSVAWALINIGSKSWQRNWESHIDILEDAETGPLYKTVNPKKTYSVSKINVLVSQFFCIIWFLMLVKYFTTHISFWKDDANSFDWQVFIASLTLIIFLLKMFLGSGRGRFGSREFKFFRREYTVNNLK